MVRRVGQFGMGIRNNFFSEGVVSYWNRLSKEVVESLSIEVFKKCVNVAVRDIV